MSSAMSFVDLLRSFASTGSGGGEKQFVGQKGIFAPTPSASLPLWRPVPCWQASQAAGR